jgi:predicted permease
MAFGIGANTAIFSLIDTVMLQSLPVRNAKDLVIIGDPTRVGGLSNGGGRTDLFSYPFYEQFRDRNRVFSHVYATGRSERLSVATSESSADENVRGRFVSGNYFDVLGVSALLGRTFSQKEVRVSSAAPVVVISFGYWERQFGRNPAVIGQKLLVNGSAFTVIGVTAPEFFGDIVGAPIDIWFPIAMQVLANPGHDYLKSPGTSWLLMMGRLRPGVSQSQAAAAINVLGPQIFRDLLKSSEPAEDLRRLLKEPIQVSSGAKGFSRIRHEFSLPLLTLMGIVILVLLICCANVANLQLARAVRRGREMGLRLAVGAGQARLVRQLLTESLVLSLLGGAAGLLFAFWGTHLLLRLVSESDKLPPLQPRLDGNVLLFTAAVSICAGLLFGLAPAWQTARLDLISNLKESRSGQPEGVTRAFGKLLIVSQIVFSLILLVGAGLFVRTLQNLENVDVGYTRRGLLLVKIDSQAGGYKDAQVNQLTRNLLDRLRRIPGVFSATVSENGLFSGTDSTENSAEIEGYTPRSYDDRVNRSDRVGPNYFEVVGTHVAQGRGIRPQDSEHGMNVVVINEAMSRFYFPHANPVGKHIFDGTGKNRVVYTIIGVVQDVKQRQLRETAARRLYTAFFQHQPDDPIDAINFEIRTGTRSALFTDAVRRSFASYNPNLPILSIQSADELINDDLRQERLVARLSSFFGVLALALAGIGLYGVLSYLTARRTIEIGIRLALGAEKRSVIGMILRETLLLIAAGLGIGIVLSLAAFRLLSNSLYGLSASDPLTILMAAVMITAVAATAACLPAWRASRVDPMVALRYE